MQASATAPDNKMVLKCMIKRSSGYAPGGGSTAPSLQTIYLRCRGFFLPAAARRSALRICEIASPGARVSALAMRRVRLAAKPTERRAPPGAKAGTEGRLRTVFWPAWNDAPARHRPCAYG